MNRQLRARILLEEARVLGIDLDDLVAAATGDHRPITVAAWIDEIAPTFGPSTARTYRPYWRLLRVMFGDRALAELTTVGLAAVVDAAAERAKSHRPDSNGRASRETCIAALRALYSRAVDAGHLSSNPAAALRKPRRMTSRRRALDDRELVGLADAIRATRRDPDLDLLLVRFHLETGARVQGALNLRRRDIDPARSTVWLREKHDSIREQPASPSLVALLVGHASERGGNGADDPVFRTYRGEPIRARRYDRLFARVREHLGCDDRIPLTAHVLRHTAVTRIGRIGGFPVAQAFAGHAPPTVTGRYLHATLADVAAAVAVLTGEEHPLAHPTARAGACAYPGHRRWQAVVSDSSGESRAAAGPSVLSRSRAVSEQPERGDGPEGDGAQPHQRFAHDLGVLGRLEDHGRVRRVREPAAVWWRRQEAVDRDSPHGGHDAEPDDDHPSLRCCHGGDDLMVGPRGARLLLRSGFLAGSPMPGSS